MTKAPPGTSKDEAGLDPKSWAFWRKRLARGLIVGALGLTAAQILPALPEDQIVQIEAPSGIELTRADLTYFSKDDGEPILGTQLIPAAPAERLTHSVRLPSDEYVISVSATGRTPAAQTETYSVTRTISMTGSTTKIHLKASKSTR